MSKVVLYTRAIYRESVTAQNGKSEDGEASMMELFNSVCKINLLDYRTALRNIQIKNFSMIDADTIVNHKDKTRKPPFAFVQQEALNELSKLDDDDVVISIDDDDWISPAVTKLDFVNGLTAWNGITLNPFTKKIAKRKDIQTTENPEVEEMTEEKKAEILEGFIAGCQGCTANVIKELLQNNSQEIHRLLQRHKQTRMVMYPLKQKLNLTEKFYKSTHLHVYVKHAGNNSAFKGVKQETDREKELVDRITRIKQGATKITNYTPDYEWAINLEKELNELNLSL